MTMDTKKVDVLGALKGMSKSARKDDEHIEMRSI
jgi:hypothetical protein